MNGWMDGSPHTRDTHTGMISVLPQRSTALLPPSAPVDLVVSELLDSTLLGEGYLAALRDLARRGFLRPGALVVS